MHKFTVKLTVKCVIAILKKFKAKTGQNWVVANFPPKFCPKKFIDLQLN